MTAGPPTPPPIPLEETVSSPESRAARQAVLAQMASSDDETVREPYRLHQEIMRLLDETIERRKERRARESSESAPSE